MANNKKWYQKLLENLASARDAKIGAIGADQVRQLYKEGEDEHAKKLAEDYLKANATGIATGVGGAGTLTSISEIGVVPTIITDAVGTAGGVVGSKTGEFIGQQIDNKYGTNITPYLTFLEGLVEVLQEVFWDIKVLLPVRNIWLIMEFEDILILNLQFRNN